MIITHHLVPQFEAILGRSLTPFELRAGRPFPSLAACCGGDLSKYQECQKLIDALPDSESEFVIVPILGTAM